MVVSELLKWFFFYYNKCFDCILSFGFYDVDSEKN